MSQPPPPNYGGHPPPPPPPLGGYPPAGGYYHPGGYPHPHPEVHGHVHPGHYHHSYRNMRRFRCGGGSRLVWFGLGLGLAALHFHHRDNAEQRYMRIAHSPGEQQDSRSVLPRERCNPWRREWHWRHGEGEGFGRARQMTTTTAPAQHVAAPAPVPAPATETVEQPERVPVVGETEMRRLSEVLDKLSELQAQRERERRV